MTGCEAFQRKLVRKSRPKPPPAPIIKFQDYSRSMTPVERYQKHYMLFDYWNDDLLRALQEGAPNHKRYRRASEDALTELTVMKDLLQGEAGGRLAPLIEERTRLHAQLRSGSLGPTEANAVWRRLETQTRRIHREFFWRDVQEHLKSETPSP